MIFVKWSSRGARIWPKVKGEYVDNGKFLATTVIRTFTSAWWRRIPLVDAEIEVAAWREATDFLSSMGSDRGLEIGFCDADDDGTMATMMRMTAP